MLKKKGKILLLVGMVALLGITGYLNIYLNSQKDPTIETNAEATADFFATYRTDRTAVREQTVMYLDSIINSELSSSESIAEAQATKIELAQTLETELKLESVIKSAGFEDVAVSTSDEKVNVILKASELTDEDVAKVLEVVIAQTNTEPANVIIIPVEG